MNENIYLLNFICQNTAMGLETIPHLLSIAEDEKLCIILKDQQKEYEKIQETAKKALSEEHEKWKDVGEMAKISSYLMINLKTMLDKSASHIAEMMIDGSTMGTVEITKHIHNCKFADKKYLDLADKLLKTEERNIEEMKAFLR